MEKLYMKVCKYCGVQFDPYIINEEDCWKNPANNDFDFIAQKSETPSKEPGVSNDRAEHYVPVKEPYYQGDGIHSVDSLQKLCNQFSEYCHQQNIIQQSLRAKVEELTKENYEADILCEKILDGKGILHVRKIESLLKEAVGLIKALGKHGYSTSVEINTIKDCMSFLNKLKTFNL